ncbi:MAG TPA: hypothetical protein VFZ79_12105 [Acidimicrobiales bacterium]
MRTLNALPGPARGSPAPLVAPHTSVAAGSPAADPHTTGPAGTGAELPGP